MPRFCVPANLYIDAPHEEALWEVLQKHALMIDGDEQVTEYGIEFAPEDYGIVWVKDDEEVEQVD